MPTHLVLDADGAPTPALARGDHFWFARYRGHPLADMGQRSRIRGVEMQVGQLSTPDSPSDVLAFLQVQFELNHLQPMVGLPQGLQGPLYLSFTPPGQQMHTVILVPNSGGTLLLASLGTPDPQADVQLPADFPAPKTVRKVHLDEIRDASSVQRNFSFEAVGSVGELRDFYLAQLPRQGFQVDEGAPTPAAAPQHWQRAFKRGSESLSLSVHQRSSALVEVAAIWVMLTVPERTAP